MDPEGEPLNSSVEPLSSSVEPLLGSLVYPQVGVASCSSV